VVAIERSVLVSITVMPACHPAGLGATGSSSQDEDNSMMALYIFAKS